jgi:hypothetical protein
MRFRESQNGCAIPRNREAMEAEVGASRSDFLREGTQVIICQRSLQEQGPGTASFGWRQVTAIPKER